VACGDAEHAIIGGEKDVNGRLILIEASPLSIPQWYAGSGKDRLPMKEETSGDFTTPNINSTAVSIYMRAACTSVS
jgi:hypothetical protein